MHGSKMDQSHAHLCSSGLDASLRSLRNGRLIQTYETLSPKEGFVKTLKDGTRVKRKRIQTERLWAVCLCINKRATLRRSKQSNVKETDFSPRITREKKKENDGGSVLPGGP